MNATALASTPPPGAFSITTVGVAVNPLPSLTKVSSLIYPDG